MSSIFKGIIRMKTTNYSVRQANKALLLKIIIQKKMISRAELSELTGLTKATISDITKELLIDEIIVEEDIGISGKMGGRKPILLCLNHKAGVSLSIDVAPNYIEGISCYLDGTAITHYKSRKPIERNTIIDDIILLIQQLMIPLDSIPYGVIGLSVAIHGIVSGNHISYTPNYDLPSNLYHLLQEKVSFPVFIHNEANLAALGEYTFGSHYQRLISLNIGVGIGSGFVEHGRIKTGSHGFSGEIGHTTLFPLGLPCSCGNQGCLEQYASQQVIAEKLNLTTSDSSHILSLYRQNDPLTHAVLKENTQFIGIAINNLIRLYDPEVIIINNSLYNNESELVHMTKESISKNAIGDTLIQSSELNKKSTILGGISTVLQHFLNIKELKLPKPNYRKKY